jgi:hypothetical protein
MTEEEYIPEEKHRAIADRIESPQPKKPYFSSAISEEDKLETFSLLRGGSPIAASERHDLPQEQSIFPTLTSRYQPNIP